jgi:hypothetical protein
MKHEIVISEAVKCKGAPIVVDGKEYDSYTDLGISQNTIRAYSYRHKCSLEEAVDHFICKKEDRVKTFQERIKQMDENKAERFEKFHFEFNGETYKSFSDACKQISIKNKCDLNPNVISRSAKVHGITKQEALERALESMKNGFEFEGKIYNSLISACKVISEENGIDIKPGTVRSYASTHKVTKQEALRHDIDRQKRLQGEKNWEDLLG